MSEKNFIVSARKYRPQRFDEVVGQDSTTSTLKNAIKSGQIAHSYLFCGTRGVGKTTMARIFAKTINCTALGEDTEACNKCESCQSFNNANSFNFVELDAASKNSVDDIRALVEQVSYPPQNAKYKVFIIDEVHMLSASAFNAFLKTLEEPPSYAKFILATTEKHKILPTILSRCQIYDFKRIAATDIRTHLQKICTAENIEAEGKALNEIAIKANGGLRDALSMFDRLTSMHENSLKYSDVITSLNILDYERFFEMVAMILQEGSAEILLLFDQILQDGFEPNTILEGLAEHLRNIWMALNDKTLVLLEVTDDVKEKFITQAGRTDKALILNLMNIVSETLETIRFSNNVRLQVELMFLKLCYVSKLMNASWEEVAEKKN